MIDWYDMQACHRREAEIHDRTNGRIYKVAYGKTRETSAPPQQLTSMSDLELAKCVLHDNDWYVRHGRRNLQERAAAKSIDAGAVSFLKDVMANNDDDTRRLRAAWALHVIGALSDENINTMLGDASEYVRGWGMCNLRCNRTFTLPPGTTTRGGQSRSWHSAVVAPPRPLTATLDRG